MWTHCLRSIARLMQLETEKDCWWRIVCDWYAQVVTEYPVRGKLHHHLGFSVARQKTKSCVVYTTSSRGEPRCVGINMIDLSHDQFSFSNSHSMIATHPFETARESDLPLWSQSAQARWLAPDARVPELFVFLHGMLFTNIQLNNFSATLARLLECLDIEEPEVREWTMMAAVNIGALLDHKESCDIQALLAELIMTCRYRSSD